MMTKSRVRKVVLLQLILVLLQFKRVQGAPVTTSPAGPTTEKIFLTGVSKQVPAYSQALLAESLPENGSEVRQKRNDHDALLDIEEKDMLLEEKVNALGQSIKKLQNFIPEVEPENIAEQPQDVKDFQTVMKLDPVKEAVHQHGALAQAQLVEGREMSSKEDEEEIEAESKPDQHGAGTKIEDNASEKEEKNNDEDDVVEAQQSNSNDAEEQKGTEASNDELDEATAIPQVYGSGTLLRPVENYRSENEGEGVDTDAGFVTENPELLKDNVFTSVLEAEVITDPYECMGTRGHLRQIGYDSKFYVDNTRLYNFKEAREICSKYNLAIAEIEGLSDHRTIQNFMSTNNYYVGNGNGGRFFIGLNDIATEGVFRHADGKSITYQNFLASQPDDNHESEDCVTIMKEHQDGPAGEADYDCNKPAHVFCMFKVDTQCYNDSKETKENRKQAQEHGMQLLVNATERAYFVSKYQTTWKDAMTQCDSKQMKLFDMDNIVTMGFFRSILRWERNFFRGPIPTVQYWTSGKFQKSHMTAPIIWHVKPDITESEERGVEKHNASFSFSGIYHWSTKKRRDPGGPHGWRKDLCVSFGFDNNPDAVPFTRNTNCDLPTFFICYVEYPDTYDGGSEEEKSSMEKPILEPGSPDDMPVPPEPENETETIELEQLLGVEGRNLNVSCGTNDETDDVTGRNGIIGNGYRWWDGFTVYIDPSYSSQSRKLINTAMDRLRKKLCIPFYLFRRDQRPYGDYVHIRNRGLCYSKIGREGGSQEMSLGNQCLNVGTIIHEMMHSLGFWHEQARPDRDRYVNIFWDNIVPNEKHNFYLRNRVATFGVPYNTLSIMHYRSWEFSKNRKDTILDKRGGKVGSLILQDTDVQKLRKMYNCK